MISHPPLFGAVVAGSTRGPQRGRLPPDMTPRRHLGKPEPLKRFSLDSCLTVGERICTLPGLSLLFAYKAGFASIITLQC